MEAAPSESKPINDTFFRRILVLTGIKFLKHLRPRQGTVLFLSRKLCVKYGSFRHLSEAATMQFIAQHTPIPLPKVYCAFKHKNWIYIVMERIDGEMFCRSWSTRTIESKAKILNQLKKLMKEMRNLPIAPEIDVANVDGGTVFDSRLPGSTMRFGPFKTIQEFHRHLRRGLEARPDHVPEVGELVAQREGQWPLPCFTHADLSSLNTLVRGDDVVGIIDWETAGWYPSHWEYTTAWHVNPRNEFWREEVDKFLEPMPKELAMEMLRWKYLGDF